MRERLLDLVGEEAVHRFLFRVRHLVGDEALDERAIAFRIHRGVEAHVARVERGQRLHDVHRETGELRQLFGARLAIELLAQDLARLDDAREVGRAVERHAHRAALARERGEDRLANPPHGVRDELDALIGIELSRSGEQADVALTDEIDERQSAVLVLLGDGDDEAQVALDELLQRVLIAGANLLRELDLLRTLEERDRWRPRRGTGRECRARARWERSQRAPRGGDVASSVQSWCASNRSYA